MSTKSNVRLIAKVARLLERKQAGKLSKRREDRFRALIENSSDLITILGADGTLKYESPSVTRILGYQPDKLVGKNTFDFIHADDVARVREVFARTFEQGEITQKLTYRFRHQNNSWRVLESIGNTFVDESGELVRVINSRDITERRRLDRAVKFHTHLLDTVEQAIVATDLGGNITYWNKFAERLYGWPAAEAAGCNVLEIIPAETTREQASEILSLLQEGMSWSGELLLRRKDGTVFPAIVTNSPIYDDERTLVGLVGISFDITERKQAEDQLKSSNEKLRALSARLQSVREEESIRIAREIHDELGGALTGLKMDLSFLGKRLPESGTEAAHQQLKAMAEFIDETIQKVRNISTELRPSMLDDLGLAAAIDWQAGEFQRRMEIECKITSLQEEITLSPEKATAVFRIFQEILTNVARHARATSVEISMEQPDGDLILKVSDNGRGIKGNEIADTKSLGLLGMRERALVFGGQVEITGAEGRGTTVTVSIPVA